MGTKIKQAKFMKQIKYFPLLIIVIILLVAGYYFFNGYPKAPEKVFDKFSCEKDYDCVPAQCCHPTGVVNKKFAPNCEGILCTQECRPGTIDCGCGRPICINYKCEVLWTRNFSWC